MVSAIILCPNLKKGVFNYETQMDKALIRAQKIIQERRKSNRNTGGTTSAKTMGRRLKYTDTVTGYKYTFTFDGAMMFSNGKQTGH